MLDDVRERMSGHLAAHRVAVVSTAGSAGAWAMPVVYHPSGLEVDLLVPRWADIAFNLRQDSRVLLVISSAENAPLCWLSYRGRAEPVEQPEWSNVPDTGTLPRPPDLLFDLVRVTPCRIDLHDERAGWGVRETLEFP